MLVSASSWDPVLQTLDEWLIEHLALAHYNGDTQTPVELIRQGLILPIVDGLDEINESERRVAIQQINSAISTIRPVVVTCRAVEYQDVIKGGGPMLRRAPVVEVLPVDVDDAIAYLSEMDWPDGTSWDGVFSRLRTDRNAPIREALSTPLMISMACTIYERLGGDPGEMVDSARFDSRHAVEDHLTERLIDAAYTTTLVMGEGRSPWTADQARRWLTFLARYLHRHRERDLRWWIMADRLLSPWVAPTLSIGLGAVTMAVVSVAVGSPPSSDSTAPTNIEIGAEAGIFVAVLAVIVWFASSGQHPGQLVFRRRGSFARLRRGFRAGALAAAMPLAPVLTSLAAVVLTISDGWTARAALSFAVCAGTAIAIIISIGLAVSVHSWLNAPPERAGRQARLARWHRTAAPPTLAHWDRASWPQHLYWCLSSWQ